MTKTKGLTAHITPTALNLITTTSHQSSYGLETGGILLGRPHKSTLEIRWAGDPGPNAIRQPQYFLRDLEHAQGLADQAWQIDGSQWIGEWHTHPYGPVEPSITDVRTYKQLLQDQELGFDGFMSLIVTPTNLGHAVNAWHIDATGMVRVQLILSDLPGRLGRRLI